MTADPKSGLTRRAFFKAAVLPTAAFLPAAALLRAAFAAPGPLSLQENQGTTSPEILREKFRIATAESLQTRPIGAVMAAVGTSFIGTPYVAHTLEVSGPEHLVVNLQGLDCTTFVESVLAISRCIKLQRMTYDAFTRQLQLIRYRSGNIDGYPSRLHYFTDWIGDNSRKGIVRDITRVLGGIPFTKTIDFMSTHRTSYVQLSDDGVATAIRAVEVRLSSSVRTYVPKADVPGVQEKLRDGDIIALTTSIPGLDVSHTGLIRMKGGRPCYLHAPLSGGTVRLSQGSLADYLARTGTHTGIIVARPTEPDER
jgi:hypothetical protein